MGNGVGMIQVHYIHCAFYFYCYSISSASGPLRHQILEVGDPGPRTKTRPFTGQRQPVWGTHSGPMVSPVEGTADASCDGGYL